MEDYRRDSVRDSVKGCRNDSGYEYRYVDLALYEKIKAYREDFHKHPECSWTEYRTSWRIAERLRQLGYEVFVGGDVCDEAARMGLPSFELMQKCERRAREEGVPSELLERMSGGRTGVVGVLRGEAVHDLGREENSAGGEKNTAGGEKNTAGEEKNVAGGEKNTAGEEKNVAGEEENVAGEEEEEVAGETGIRVVAFRFDIDALSMEEERTEYNAEYRSLHEGMMHACGHDGHAAAGLGLAEVLGRHRKELRGEVRLIFQPAEEGCHGAAAIVARGWLDDVDMFLSGHIGIGCRRLGEIGACSEGFLATSKLDFRFRGKSAHAGKAPEQGRNALLAAAKFTVDAYELVRGQDGVLVNVGRFVSGSGRNIIAADAWLEAETRGTTQEKNLDLCARMMEMAKHAGQLYRVGVEAIKIGEAGTGTSSPSLVRKCKSHAREMGIEAQYQESASFGASEDVTAMMERVQNKGGEAAFFMFGTPLRAEHHHGAFDFDTEVLRIMTEFYARAVLQ